METNATTRTRTVAVAGNPNSGKTTLFNGLTGSKQRIGNWPGVTVEKKEGLLNFDAVSEFLSSPFMNEYQHTTRPERAPVGRGAEQVHLVDLPGIYSLSASSEDEIVARNFLLSADVDLVVNIVDASNLQRNLYLTLQLVELKIPLLIVLNMMDVADKKGLSIDVDHLSEHLGVPVIPASATDRGSIRSVKQELYRSLQDPSVPSARVDYPEEFEAAISRWEAPLGEVSQSIGANPRWLSVKLLEQDPWITERVVAEGALPAEAVDSVIEGIRHHTREDPDVVIADYRYGFIHGLTRHISRSKLNRQSMTDLIDRVVMNRLLGIPIFFAVMYLVFWFTMVVGDAFIDFFDILFGTIFVDGFGAVLRTIAAPDWLVAILAGGIGAGIQTVATFVPIIFAMFLALAALEDSGYMARAAFVMDRFMRWVGLPGKSFVPMMVGFGCTVPAIMGTRTLDTKRDRFMTIFMAPHMSCGARLPVYAFFAGAFFPASSGFVVFSLYVVGIVIAILTGLLLKHTLFRGEVSHFIMELPPYHAPRGLHILSHAFERLKVFVYRAGVTITIIVAILSVVNSIGLDGSFGRQDTGDSVLAGLGRAVTPVFGPMGIEDENWPATVGIFTGMFAKEAVVGTLSSLYSQSDQRAAGAEVDILGGLGEALASIPENLSGAVSGLLDPLGFGDAAAGGGGRGEPLVFQRMKARFDSAGAYAYLLFILIYIPCVAAIGAAVKEMGGAYAAVMGVYQTVLAWIVATLYYQLTAGAGVAPVLVAVSLLGVIIVAFSIAGRWTRRELELPG
ncbi:MAG: ferrous iron transport protein B [Spirochaetes bacterium]|jgi:ferrous iron transport protein B|nr:ferrous iron transport protein B [Spirochaetota bacterium]